MPDSSPSIRIGQSIDLKEQESIKKDLEFYLKEKNYPEVIISLLRLNDIDGARTLLNDWRLKLGKLEKLESDNKVLKEELEKKGLPPLMDGVYLKPSVDDPLNFAIIGAGQQRMEVQFLNPLQGELSDLPGRQVWINSDRQIVKVGENHVRGEAVEVIENLKDGRLKVKGRGNEELVVEILSQLATVSFDIGDVVRIDSALGIVLEKMQSKERSMLGLDRIPNVHYNDVGGLSTQITKIEELIEYPSTHRSVYERYGIKRPKGVLLYGPPGCGKTMVAKAIANGLSRQIRDRLRINIKALELYFENEKDQNGFIENYRQWCREMPAYDQANQDISTKDRSKIRTVLENYLETQKIDLKNGAHEVERLSKLVNDEGLGYFLTINGPEILNKYVGETESSIRHIFALARKMATVDTPVVIFFDELESLFSRRGSGISSDVENTIVPQLLSEIDGIDDIGNVMLIGASNRFELIDPAVLRPGRFDVKLYIGRPDADAASDILRKYLISSGSLIAGDEVGKDNNREKIVDSFIRKIVSIVYSPKSYLLVYEETRPDQFPHRRDNPKSLKKPIGEIVSGAMLENITSRAKRSASHREINKGNSNHKNNNLEIGLRWSDFYGAIKDECTESKDQYINELFPSRDIVTMEKYKVEVYLDENFTEREERTRWFSEKKRSWLVKK